jgi:FkbM family methyltransferase
VGVLIGLKYYRAPILEAESRMNRALISLRGALRSLGLTPILAQILNRIGLFGGAVGHEEKFSQQMLSELRPGDVVWEVGANLGLYTVEFCERVGPEGRVIAFEPTPACFESLKSNCSAELGRNCEVHRLALGRKTGSVLMQIAADPLGASHSVLTSEQQVDGMETIEVEMVRGDDLVGERGMPRPDFLKIDVEGSELDVLQGLGELLSDVGCRAVFCEVHFGLLAERGQPYASQEIEKLLRESGLEDQTWIDASHIVALRRDSA